MDLSLIRQPQQSETLLVSGLIQRFANLFGLILISAPADFTPFVDRPKPRAIVLRQIDDRDREEITRVLLNDPYYCVDLAGGMAPRKMFFIFLGRDFVNEATYQLED